MGSFLNDELVDDLTHKLLLSHLKPYSKLTGTIKQIDGTTEKVTVKVGSLYS